MSIEVMNDVWRYSKAKGTDRLVLIALADQANDQRERWPSVSSIGKKCLLTPRNVQKRIRSLEELGEVIVIYGAGTSSSKGGVRSNRYRIIVYMADPDPVGADTISTPQTLSDTTPSESDDPVASDTQTLSDTTPRTPSPATPEPKGEPSLNPQSLATDDLTVTVAKVCGLELDHLTSSARRVGKGSEGDRGCWRDCHPSRRPRVALPPEVPNRDTHTTGSRKALASAGRRRD